MAEVPPPPVPTQLIVFADDWGRHPSSSQHLIRELLPQYSVLWVNTVGTRKPRISDLTRLWERLPKRKSALERAFDRIVEHHAAEHKDQFTVISPLMYPGFRTQWQRRFNTGRLAKAIHAHTRPDHRRVVITTLPITANLVGCIDADRWLYYCVDDYSTWPGTDQAIMAEMEATLVERVDALVSASGVLRDRLRGFACRDEPKTLTHGVNLELWDGRLRTQWNEALNPNDPLDEPFWWYESPDWTEAWSGQSVVLFWGLIDARLDVNWLARLKECDAVDRIALVGPSNAPPEQLRSWADLPGKVDHKRLPVIATASSVLIMPYIDAAVTRAMQPLKLKEYLATMKPVVVRDLPSTRQWADCCDLASTPEAFVRLVKERIRTGTPRDQLEARKRRLADESWSSKAAQLAAIINEGA
ncbi:MAG: hypothetical protein ACPGYV_01960 [Phycisphaeraceae bacterium]